MYNVLLVDDEPIVKIALKTMIDWESIDCTICGTASDGIEALHLAKETNADIIITDLKMPNMDGLMLIKALKESGFNGKIIVASNFGEYELVREALILGAMDYILKISIQPETLITQINKIKALLENERQLIQEEQNKVLAINNNLKKVKNTVLKDFFSNADYNIDYLTQNKLIQFEFLNTEASFIYLSLYRIKDSIPEQSKISLSFIENMIVDVLDYGNKMEVFQVDKNAIILLIGQADEKQWFNIETFSHRIYKLIKLYMTITPIIIYSSSVLGYDAMRTVFIKAKETIHSIFYDPIDVMEVNQTVYTHTIKFTNVVNVSRTFLQHIKNKHEVQLELYLHSLVEQCKHDRIHPAALKILIVKSLEFIRLLDEQVYIIDDEQFDVIRKRLEESKSVAQFINYTMMLLNQYALETKLEMNRQGMRKEVLQVLSYIGENYQEKLTLQGIAEHVNFSENYLCKVFREQIGVSLVHYINTVRLNKAAEFILNGHSYIKEVANAVGISDQFYFSRMFKRHFGVSPTDYKQWMEQKASAYE